MSKMPTSLTKKEFETQVDNFIKRVNKSIADAQKWVTRKHQEIRTQADKDLKNQKAYAQKQGYTLDSRALENAIDEYLKAAFAPLTSKGLRSLPAKKHLQDTICKSTDNDQYRKHLLEWPDTLEKQLIALQDAAFDAVKDADDDYVKMLGSKDSELYTCFDGSVGHLVGDGHNPSIKLTTAMTNAYFGGFDKKKYGDNVSLARQFGLDNFDKLYETTK